MLHKIGSSASIVAIAELYVQNHCVFFTLYTVRVIYESSQQIRQYMGWVKIRDTPGMKGKVYMKDS